MAKNFIVPTFNSTEQLYLEHQRLLTLTKGFKLRSEIQNGVQLQKKLIIP
jgi:hypothetical protein